MRLREMTEHVAPRDDGAETRAGPPDTGRYGATARPGGGVEAHGCPGIAFEGLAGRQFPAPYLRCSTRERDPDARRTCHLAPPPEG